MASEDARYRQSTQYRLWSFSPAQLSSMREKTNALAQSNISERLLSTRALPEFLTPAEELQLLNFYTIDLLRAGNFFNLRTDMRATAAVFLRRFYLTNSIMTYPPTDMLKTCLFFGCKAEGHYPSVGKFAEQFPNTTGEDVLAGEFLLCQGLRFAFDVKHPFRALEGAIMELRRYGNIEDSRISSAHSRAREILKFSPLVTDAYFHYTPSQIMLAALSLADQELAERVVHETFHHPALSDGAAAAPTRENRKGAAAAGERARLVGAEMRDRVLEVVNACREVLAKEPPERMTAYWGTPDSNQITRPLLRKLKKCHDPDRWNLVELQRARREQAALKEDAEDDEGNGARGSLDGDGAVFGDADGRDVKRRKVAKAPEDPFGGPL
ncbi:cyclin-like protein [Coniochaeta ligniaria NRRL 30616]|uniref:Cyclin-like protein n=1 Tax=Coniochaeta ligniaria NRRL 30616 TaxID=1408157 RepID=A0A1J7IPQ1_9PEZI|nr:cyclin-like protein [Coniochaeta ligniaria NRRL 30616]